MLLPNAGKEWYNGVEVITLLKVFLVEDECVVREGLRDCIDWERYGFEFCGDAPDGELALPQIRKLRPDILITDIKMPFMDGLALSKLVCAELPETRIILISGHNDFEFAQEAIEIGVEQYLLKPVTKASLLKTLEDVSRKIDEEREQKDYLRRFQQEGPEYEQFARRKFFEQITSGTLRVSEIYEQAKKLQIDIDAEGYTVILLTLQSRGTAEYSQTLAERLEELMAYLLRYGEYLLFRCNLMTYCVIVKGSAAGLDEAVRRCLENIERRCGGDEALIRQRIQDAGMEERVIILGKKENPYPYIKACGLYVQPSRYEGKSVTVREAQILNKPVVITGYATSASQLEDGVDGVIVPMDNEGCAAGIAAVLRDEALRQKLTENTKIRDYTNAGEIEKIYRLLENV